MASLLNASVATTQCLSASQAHKHAFLRHSRPTSVTLPLRSSTLSSRSTLAFARRRNKRNSDVTSSSKIKKKSSVRKDDVEDEELDDDAFEALFAALEEDLRKEGFDLDDTDDEITEEDLADLERKLAEAIGESDDDIDNDAEGYDDEDADADEEEEEEYEEEDERFSELKTWQKRRLAQALKAGKRKVSIRNLAADVCLDRAIVLEMLREPPPELVLMSAALPDEPEPTVVIPETKPVDIDLSATKVEDVKPKPKVQEPVHAMQRSWFEKKRLKKVHVETLEQVYERTKRPTNSMISSIVQVTNLPRRRIIKWFEDKRAEDGDPEERLPYQRSTNETVFPS